MMNGNTTRRVVLLLGIISGIAVGVSFLALMDIGHGEADLTLEWRVLRVCALAIVTFHVAALTALLRAERLTWHRRSD
jgi:hypothetical protein